MSIFSKIDILWNTVKYLKPIQWRYRVKSWGRRFHSRNVQIPSAVPVAQGLNFVPSLSNERTYLGNNTFNFLNLQKSFGEKVDWECVELGRLWGYNLNYFEFLNQEVISVEEGMRLIRDFIQHFPKANMGVEPYPLSLRSVNWIRFLSSHNIEEVDIDTTLYTQLNLLIGKLEYHLLGNHLLENGFALLFGAYYFNDSAFYKKAKSILVPELREQVLGDGGHFERSPMYHCIMLYRVLDCYNLVHNNTLFERELEVFLKEKAEAMLGWLKEIIYRDGKIPLLNDAAFGIAPVAKDLMEYGQRLGITCCKKVKLKESGYRKLQFGKFELLMDVGEVGPDYQPGHAHADTFSFELYINGRPVIVDTGTSTYEVNDTRFYERSTAAHNTVVVSGQNSSQVWAGHRVARRARVRVICDEEERVVAQHDGYKRLGTLHTRGVEKIGENIWIVDEIDGEGCAYLHFMPEEKIILNGNILTGSDFCIELNGMRTIESFSSWYASEFNKRVERQSFRIFFDRRLETIIK